MGMRIYCFGEFEIYYNAERIPEKEFGGAKVRYLLKILLTKPNTFFLKDQLIEWLWDENTLPDNPQNTLRNYIYHLRKALESGVDRGDTLSVIHTGEDGSYGFFVNDDCWIDVKAFEEQLQVGETAASQQRWDEVIQSLSQAVALYRGDFLKDALYENWATQRRNELKEKYCHALAQLAEGYAHQDEFTKAIHCCQKAIALAPGHEGLHRQLMLYCCYDGNRDKAIKTFETLVAYLKDEIDVEPEAQTVALYQSVLNGEISAKSQISLGSPSPLKRPYIAVSPALPSEPKRRFNPPVLVVASVLSTLLVVFLVWNSTNSPLTALDSSATQIQFFQGDAGAFKRAADFPPVMVDFDEIKPGTDLSGKALDDVRFERAGISAAPLIVVRGAETFTPAGYRCEPLGDRSLHKLFPTTGGNVLSPGGTELAPGPNPALEDDGLVMVFKNPVSAVGFDILWQSADGDKRDVTLLDKDGHALFSQTVRLDLNAPGMSPPGGNAFVGFVATSNTIARVVVGEEDNDNCREDANTGYDTIRFKRTTPSPQLPRGYRFDLEWGSSGTNPGEFSVDLGPRGIALAEEGGATFVYESDYANRRVQKFDAQGRFVSQSPVAGALQDIEYDGKGAFYVRAVKQKGERSEGVLIKLDAQLNEVWSVKAPAAEWVSYGLCVDSDGNVHVPVALSTTPTDHMMYKYDPNGKLLTQYGAGLVKGQSNCESSPDGFVYVVDGPTSNFRKFTNEGQLTDTIHIGYDISAVAIDKNSGNVFLALYTGDDGTKIRAYDASFRTLAEWGGQGKGGGLFSLRVRDIEVDHQGVVYVNDGGNYLVQKFLLDE